MAVKQEDYICTKPEEIANILTSAFGVFVSIIAFLVMWFKSSSSSMLLATFLYGTSLITLFATSSIFHWFNYILKCRIYPPTKKDLSLQRVFQLLDRSAIYFVISSSYAPWFILAKFPENAWFSSMKEIYFIAALGILFELTLAKHYPMAGILFYVSTGGITPLSIFAQAIAPGFTKVVIASLIYLLGVIFFLSDGKIPFAHAIWHIFVLVASAIHFNNVYLCFYN